MQESKIRLSAAERELFGNTEIILTKNSILQKTTGLLSEVQNELPDEAPLFIRSASPPPKIAKGENYLGLPYLILDYPRIANGENLCFIRSMFWWGNFYSSTLQLAGKYKAINGDGLQSAYAALAEGNYFIGTGQDPWVHHFGEDNYQAIHSISKRTFATLLSTMPHTKIAARWPLSEWDSAAGNLIESWKFLAGMMNPNDDSGLADG